MDKATKDLLDQAKEIKTGEVTFLEVFETYNQMMGHRWHCIWCEQLAMALVVENVRDLVIDCIGRGVCDDTRVAAGWAQSISNAASEKLTKLLASSSEDIKSQIKDQLADILAEGGMAKALEEGRLIPIYDSRQSEIDPLDVN